MKITNIKDIDKLIYKYILDFELIQKYDFDKIYEYMIIVYNKWYLCNS